MNMQNSLILKYKNDIAILEMDLQGEKVNKLSTNTLAFDLETSSTTSLNRAITFVESLFTFSP